MNVNQEMSLVHMWDLFVLFILKSHVFSCSALVQPGSLSLWLTLQTLSNQLNSFFGQTLQSVLRGQADLAIRATSYTCLKHTQFVFGHWTLNFSFHFIWISTFDVVVHSSHFIQHHHITNAPSQRHSLVSCVAIQFCSTVNWNFSWNFQPVQI